eukprot:74731_1
MPSKTAQKDKKYPFYTGYYNPYYDPNYNHDSLHLQHMTHYYNNLLGMNYNLFGQYFNPYPNGHSNEFYNGYSTGYNNMYTYPEVNNVEVYHDIKNSSVSFFPNTPIIMVLFQLLFIVIGVISFVIGYCIGRGNTYQKRAKTIRFKSIPITCG